MKYFSLFFLIFNMFFTSCKKESINCDVECNYKEELIFETKFDNTKLERDKYQNTNFKDIDNSFLGISSWEKFNNNSNIGEVNIHFEDGDNIQRNATIVNDPENNNNKVLQFQIIEPHINEGIKKKGRVQMQIHGNKCLREIYQTVRVRFHPDMVHIKEWEERAPWLSIFEFWNNAGWVENKQFRITVNLFKDKKGPVDAITFHAKADWKPDNCEICSLEESWEEEATDFSIPFGTWMQIEVYLKEGDKNNGKFFMAVTPEGGSRVELFNITGTTQHPKETCPDGFSHFQPMKFYTSDKLINYMKNANKSLSVMWDDFKLYQNKPF